MLGPLKSVIARFYCIVIHNILLFSHQTLVEHNNLQGRIHVIPGRVEEVHVPEQVDIIISEPMGYMLFNERMLETYIHARVNPSILVKC